MNAIDRLAAKVRNAKLSLRHPIDLASVEKFETVAGVRIPEDYRDFLLEIANGGTKHCRMVPLSDWCASYWIDAQPEMAARPCILTPDAYGQGVNWLEMANVPDWERRWEKGEWDPMFGTIAIAEIGCGLFFSMVMTGPHRGKIFSWGDHALNPPFFYDNRGFGDWFESCVDLILAGQGVHFLDGRLR